MNASDPIVCYTFFVDGSRRPVFEDPAGQYVIGDRSGGWFIPPEIDMPVIVETLT